MKVKLIIIIVILFLLALIVTSLNFNNDTIESWHADKNEYPKSEYRLNELPVSHKSAVEVRQFFEDSDANHDGLLKDDEINAFDYKIKHSQYTFNGPYSYN